MAQPKQERKRKRKQFPMKSAKRGCLSILLVTGLLWVLVVWDYYKDPESYGYEDLFTGRYSAFLGVMGVLATAFGMRAASTAIFRPQHSPKSSTPRRQAINGCARS